MISGHPLASLRPRRGASGLHLWGSKTLLKMRFDAYLHFWSFLGLSDGFLGSLGGAGEIASNTHREIKAFALQQPSVRT